MHIINYTGLTAAAMHVDILSSAERNLSRPRHNSRRRRSFEQQDRLCLELQLTVHASRSTLLVVQMECQVQTNDQFCSASTAMQPYTGADLVCLSVQANKECAALDTTPYARLFA